MNIAYGNIIELTRDGNFDVLVHGCNCFARMKSGLAGEIARRHYPVVAADLNDQRTPREKLGGYTSATFHNGTHQYTIVNGYTQYFYGRDPGVRYVDYVALREVFRLIKQDFAGLRIAIPKIGAGLGNGDWSTIKAIIDDVLHGENYTFVYLTK